MAERDGAPVVTPVGAADHEVTVTVNGRTVEVAATCSLVDALLHLGPALDGGVGCMGQGVCGSCRALVRRAGADEVVTVLACTTLVEAGMHATFLEDLGEPRLPRYDLDGRRDPWAAAATLLDTFPEAHDCRHCGGCVAACPVGIAVEDAVALAVEGRLDATAAAFDECVMCDLCTATCPDHIAPNHLGLFARRIRNHDHLRPNDLLLRLHQIDRGLMTVDPTAPVPGEPSR